LRYVRKSVLPSLSPAGSANTHIGHVIHIKKPKVSCFQYQANNSLRYTTYFCIIILHFRSQFFSEYQHYCYTAWNNVKRHHAPTQGNTTL